MNTSGRLTLEPISEEIIQLDLEFFPTPWSRDHWLKLDLKTHSLFGWRVGENLVGLSLLWTLEGDDTAHLLKILLLESSRGCGTAELFWAEIEGQLREKGLKTVYLEVEARNFRAKNFYEKVGFKVLRKNKQYYSNGDDALIMNLTL